MSDALELRVSKSIKMWQIMTKSFPTHGASFTDVDEDARRTLRSRGFLPLQQALPMDGILDERTGCRSSRPPPRVASTDATRPAVEMLPADSVRRRALTGHGMAAEYVQCTNQCVVKYRFRAPVHLLVAYEQGECREGETFVEGLPRSTLRSFARKLTFVPAGHEYHAWHDARTKPNIIHFYFDPADLSWLENTDISLTPRLFFEDVTLWQSVLKMKNLVEASTSEDRSYFEALGMVLILELTRLIRGKAGTESPVRGGLAAWQQRIVTTYIEEHFAERLPLSALAELVRLSRYHFCRSFKRSFGKPPHRYQLERRIERAKLLLSKPGISVTDVALTVGFSSSNTFATTFRKETGMTPTAYNRSQAGL